MTFKPIIHKNRTDAISLKNGTIWHENCNDNTIPGTSLGEVFKKPAFIRPKRFIEVEETL